MWATAGKLLRRDNMSTVKWGTHPSQPVRNVMCFIITNSNTKLPVQNYQKLSEADLTSNNFKMWIQRNMKTG